MAYNAELQMLREFYLFYSPGVLCEFCSEPIAEFKKGATFGHRRHTKVHELNFTVHHDDENRDNNDRTNLRGSHSNCHKRHHNQKRREDKLHGKQENEEGKEEGKEKQVREDGDHV